ncbi:hypothetical protein V6N13_008240 [Hibiscus sabdariffa]
MITRRIARPLCRRRIIHISALSTFNVKKLVVGPRGGSAGPPHGEHRSARPYCRRCAPGLNWPGRSSGAVTLKKLECSKQAYCHDPPSCPRLNQGKTRTMGHFKDKNAPKMDLERFNMVYTPLGAVQDNREGTMSIQNRRARCQGPRVPGRFRSKRGTAWDQGVPAGSRSFQHGPGATDTQDGFPDRPMVRQKGPGGSRRFRQGLDRPRVRQKDPGGSRRFRQGLDRPRVRQKDPGGSRRFHQGLDRPGET